MAFDGTLVPAVEGALQPEIAPRLPHMSAPRFDWYGATVPDVCSTDLINLATRSGDGIRVGPKQRSVLKGGYYRRWVTLWDRFGPCAQVHWEHKTSPHPRLDVWGPHSERLAAALRATYRHFTTRMDASCDGEHQGGFDALEAFLVAFVASYPIPLNTKFEKATKGIKSAGRTFYVGAEGSEVRLCLYEKGCTKGFEDRPNLVRVELRVQPDSTDDQLMLSTRSPEQIWGFSKWSTQLAPAILCTHVPRCAKSMAYGKTTGQQKVEAFLRSYGPHLPMFFEMCDGAEKFGPWALGLYEETRSTATNRGGRKRERARGRPVEQHH